MRPSGFRYSEPAQHKSGSPATSSMVSKEPSSVAAVLGVPYKSRHARICQTDVQKQVFAGGDCRLVISKERGHTQEGRELTHNEDCSGERFKLLSSCGLPACFTNFCTFHPTCRGAWVCPHRSDLTSGHLKTITLVSTRPYRMQPFQQRMRMK
jgi:hypothetical protein